MAFDNAAPSRAATRRANKELILGIGGRAFINRPHAAVLAQSLADDRAQSVVDDLVDGEEVEIISWRPRSLHGLAYQIKRVRDGNECWILATQLRRQREPQPLPAAAAEPEVVAAAEPRAPRSRR